VLLEVRASHPKAFRLEPFDEMTAYKAAGTGNQHSFVLHMM
jgi:hypothetical protein